MLKDGYIVVAACQDECVTNLSDASKQFFADMGSTEIWNLKYREGFAFIGIKGRKECQEQRTVKVEDCVSATQIFKMNDYFTGEEVADIYKALGGVQYLTEAI